MNVVSAYQRTLACVQLCSLYVYVFERTRMISNSCSRVPNLKMPLISVKSPSQSALPVAVEPLDPVLLR